MRDIRFRAWNPEIKKMSTGNIEDFEWYTVLAYNKESGVPIMQYTGLKDKNGRDMFHKDIVQMGPFRYVVEWDDKKANFYLAAENELDTRKYTLSHAVKSGEVVGNTYEN